MIDFEEDYFRKFSFAKSEIGLFVGAAERDLKIAEDSTIPEVVFKFSYDALVKLGIAAIANEGYKTRSVMGHHVKIMEKLAKILNDNDVAVIGNRMRQKRNADLYEGDDEITEKESAEYLSFVKAVTTNVKRRLK